MGTTTDVHASVLRCRGMLVGAQRGNPCQLRDHHVQGRLAEGAVAPGGDPCSLVRCRLLREIKVNNNIRLY